MRSPRVHRPPAREGFLVILGGEHVHVGVLVPASAHPDELILAKDGRLLAAAALGHRQREPRSLEHVFAPHAKLLHAVRGDGVLHLVQGRVAALGAEDPLGVPRHLLARVAPEHPSSKVGDSHSIRREKLHVHLEDDVLHGVVRGDAGDGGLERHDVIVRPVSLPPIPVSLPVVVLLVLVLRPLRHRSRRRLEKRRRRIRRGV
mmetsp:Transcript_4007/g.16353  ORF Transcript_4007/g.16353 Transcript_4007/m.16353 type:complete len:203 (+) Transcript_4007:829-1437(+)